ncbi:MAG: tyrosine-type recombinase/integrase [Methanobacterium paludis]|nr:tyrosine-type recombinase/integrase [Methanobacterium paludis]
MYLKSRNKPNNDDKLFLNQSQLPYSASGFSKVFTGLSNRLCMGKHENRYNFFHAHGLRDFFSTTLNNKGIPYAIYKKMMGQTLSGVDTAYIHVNRESCKREYERCLKDLSTEKVEIRKVTSDEIKTIINENQNLRTDVDKMKEEMKDYKTFKPLIKVFMEDEEIQKRVEERLNEK